MELLTARDRGAKVRAVSFRAPKTRLFNAAFLCFALGLSGVFAQPATNQAGEANSTPGVESSDGADATEAAGNEAVSNVREVSSPQAAALSAVDGRLDLGGIDLRTSEPVALAGEWEFISGQFMSPAEYLYWTELEFRRNLDPPDIRRRRYLALPGDWNQIDLPGVRQGVGHGTFVLRLSGLPVDADLALRVGRVGAAYRLFLVPVGNLELVREKHEIEDSPFRPFLRQGFADEIYSVPHMAPALRSFTVTEPDLFIILHVSNHDAARGGPLESIYLGQERELSRHEAVWRAVHFTFFGFLLALGLLHLARLLYLVRRADVFFLLLAFLGLSYLIFHAHRAEDFLPGFDRFNFYWFRRSEVVSLALLLAVWQSYPLFMNRIPLPRRPVLVVLWLGAIAYTGLAVFAPLRLAEEFRGEWETLLGLVLSYNLTGILLRAREGDYGGLPWLVSTAIIGGGYFYDIVTGDYLAGRLPAGLLLTAVVAVLASNLFGGRSLGLARRMRRRAREYRQRRRRIREARSAGETENESTGNE